jgi:hypothetical protein
MSEKLYCIVDLTASENADQVCFAAEELKGFTLAEAEAWIVSNPDEKYKIMRHNDIEE